MLCCVKEVEGSAPTYNAVHHVDILQLHPILVVFAVDYNGGRY